MNPSKGQSQGERVLMERGGLNEQSHTLVGQIGSSLGGGPSRFSPPFSGTEFTGLS